MSYVLYKSVGIYQKETSSIKKKFNRKYTFKFNNLNVYFYIVKRKIMHWNAIMKKMLQCILRGEIPFHIVKIKSTSTPKNTQSPNPYKDFGLSRKMALR